MLEARVGRGTTNQGAQLEQGDDHEDGDGHTAELAQNELQILPLSQPPVHRHPLPIPSGMEFRITRRRLSCFLTHFRTSLLLWPLGMTKDFTQSSTAISLYCWIAPAGSTCLGQTRVHSPTNVHPQTPSGWASTAIRSSAPWSRESML